MSTRIISLTEREIDRYFIGYNFATQAGLKVNDQLVTYATRFSAVHLKNYLWSHHCALKAKVQCDFSSAYSPDHTNVLRLINTNLNIDITQPCTK